MCKINSSKICFLIVASFAVSMLIAFSAENTFAQRDFEKRMKKVDLKKDARKNGYKIEKEGENYYLKANNVFDPITKKRLEGDQTLSYGCEEPEIPVTRTPIQFSAGNAQRVRIACAIIIRPKILILDEPTPN